MGGVAGAALFLAGQAAAGLAIAASAYLAGILLLPPRETDRPAERAVVGSALGLAALAQVLLLLGLAGGITRAAVAILLLLIAGSAGLLRWRAARAELGLLRRAISGAPAAVRLAAGVLILLLFAAALRPPTAFDETLYHLPYARAFAESGGLPWLPDLRFPVFPQAAEALFAACLVLSGDVAAHMVPLLATLLCAAMAGLWASRVAGPGAGYLAAALMLGEPVAAYHAGVAYVDPLLMLFAAAGLYALSLAAEHGSARWVLAAGVLAGTAASVKYHGLYFAAAGAVLVALGPRPRMRRTVLFAAAALAAALVTYGRLIAETGNPVFPFFASIFGENPWSDWGRLLRADDAGRGPVATAGELAARAARYPFELLLRRGPFWHPPVSPFLMAAAVFGAVVAFRRKGPARAFLAVAAGYLVFVLFLSPDPRYLLPLAPGAAALGAAAFGALAARWRTPVLLTLLTSFAIAPGAAYVLQLEARRGAPVLTPAARERYLEARRPHYRAIRMLNERLGPRYSLYAFGAEEMSYFARGRFRGDHYGPWAYERVRESATRRGSLCAALLEIGATHLLVPAGSPEGARAASEGLEEEYRDERSIVYRLTRPGAAPDPSGGSALPPKNG